MKKEKKVQSKVITLRQIRLDIKKYRKSILLISTLITIY